MNPAGPTTTCRVCGTVSAGQNDGLGEICLGCLLDAALFDEEEAAPPVVASTVPLGHDGADGPGSRFAHYEISTHDDGLPVELGRGAMGITYRAIDTVLRHEVALKVVAPDLAMQPRVRTRFLREAQAAAGLRHPHIASVFFFGERPGDGQPFYAMELVDGETLHARVKRCGGLPVDTALEIGAQIADALAAAEARGLTHRDLKPANVMLAAGEKINAKIIDFGLAKAVLDNPDGHPTQTRSGDFVGTPAFASPEHFNVWQDTDTRSDFYALGATLWYALTGHPPFGGRTLAEIHDHQLHGPLPVDQLRAARVPQPVTQLLHSLLSPDPAGRPQNARDLAAAIARCREGIAAPSPGARRRIALMTVAAILTMFAAAAAGWLAYQQSRLGPIPVSTPARAAEKSIAVLPFDDLSDDKANAFFANGVQDEILTDLAKVAALKVISRTSVLGYRDPAKRPSAREISQALGVAYLLEGSVQRQGDRVRLSVQLIDAANDRHVWAETFARDLSDVFTIQSEVANTIADKLQARLSGAEKAALDEPPTRDLAAYELYLHAKELMYNFDPNTSKWEPLQDAGRLLDEATARDPSFFAAWCLLANVHGNLLFYNADPTPTARQALAEKALGNVRRLRPDAGETHLTAAIYDYNIHDSARGRPELDLARQKLPNNWKVLFVTGTTGMFDGRWTEGIAAMEKARLLNPRHVATLDMLSIMYGAVRRYDEARRVTEDAIAAGVNPDYFAMRHAAIVQNQTGDTSEFHAVFSHLAGQGGPSERTLVTRWDTALRDRDFDEAARVVAADPRKDFNIRTRTVLPRAALTGAIAYARGDLDAARKDYETVRPIYEEAIRNRPEDATAWMNLADLDARLGRKEDALREGLRSVNLMPITHDAMEGPKMAVNLGWIFAAVGEKERGLAYLESLISVPNAYDYGYLAKHPDFDVFHGEPRFQALLEAMHRPVDMAKFNPADFPPP